jgi:hypothetical protein
LGRRLENNGPDGDTSHVLWPSEAFLLLLKFGKELAREVAFTLIELFVSISKFFDHPVLEVDIDEYRAA